MGAGRAHHCSGLVSRASCSDGLGGPTELSRKDSATQEMFLMQRDLSQMTRRHQQATGPARRAGPGRLGTEQKAHGRTPERGGGHSSDLLLLDCGEQYICGAGQAGSCGAHGGLCRTSGLPPQEIGAGGCAEHPPIPTHPELQHQACGVGPNLGDPWQGTPASSPPPFPPPPESGSSETPSGTLPGDLRVLQKLGLHLLLGDPSN